MAVARAQQRSTRLVAAVAATALVARLVVVAYRLVEPAFLPAAASPPRGAASAAAVAVATAAAAGNALPAFAEEAGKAVEKAPEGFLNFGKVELGGGFAINLDIPETGIVNIVVLIAGLVYLLGPLLSESMSTREKEIQQDIDDAIAKFSEAEERLAEAQKNKAQAQEVIAEIEASIEKDKASFAKTIESTTKNTLERQAQAAERTIKELEGNAA